MANYSIQGGPAIPAKVVTTGASQGGPALPVYQILAGDGIQVQGGPGVPMKLITDPSYPRVGGPAQPIQFVAPGYAPYSQGGVAIPVYCVNEANLLSLINLPWYLAYGLTASDVVCAYQPKGATSQAESYKNIANPGTNDATAPTPPTWNASDGWIFNGVDQYLDTGVEPASSWSAICRFTDAPASSAILFGVMNYNAANFCFSPNGNGTASTYLLGKSSTPGMGKHLSGIAGVSQYQGYFSGLPDGDPVTAEAWANTGASLTFLIGCYDYAGDSPTLFCISKIQALALYNKPLSAAQMLAISNNMAAL